MKYVLVLALIALVFWFWRSQRLSGKNRRASENSMKNAQNRNPSTPADEIAPCSICQVHLPRKDLLRGHNGLYCSEAHKQLAGD